MAAIALPTCPIPDSAQPFLRDFGGDLVPFLGGKEQRINRIGTRFGVRYTMPPMEGDDARAFVARLTRGKQSRVLMPWPLADFDPGDAGSPAINAAAAGGSAISIKGLFTGYTIKEGQFLSLVHSGIRYVHMATGDVTASGGVAAVSIFPPLRTPISVDDTVEIEAPMIEGAVMPGDEWSWQVAFTRETGISFSVAEVK